MRYLTIGPTCPGLCGFHPLELGAFGHLLTPYGACRPILCGVTWSAEISFLDLFLS